MTWEMILAVAGGIVLIGNAGAMIYKWIRPALKVKDDVAELDRRTKKDFEAINELKEALQRNEEFNRLQLTVMMDILNHMIDNNSVDEMKETRRKVQEILADN